jgi:16S rRNA (cytosine967-C5)-methyltransferase
MRARRGPAAPARPATEARRLALRVLHAVDDGGAFANLALDQALEGSPLSGADRSLATELVYGVTRWRGRLDYVLDRLSTTPVADLPVWIRNVLRMGLYQILFLDRVPERAAVSESVALAREFGHRGTAGLVNAVLRQAARRGAAVALPPAVGDPVPRLAVEFSHPEWLARRWVARYGLEEATRLCRVDNEGAPLTLRVNTTRTSREELTARLTPEGVAAEPGRLFPEAVVAHTDRPLRSLAAYAEGLFSVQDESSMAAARAVRPQAGQTVIDACAGVGGKATHLAELAGDRGRVVALDIFNHKLRLLTRAAERLGLRSIETRRIDARELPSAGLEAADAVLVDAPCSGLGVLRRRPDLRWRVTEEDLADLARLQAELLSAAADCVRPGGVVVYATCSMEPEENQKVVEGFLSNRREFVPDDTATAAGLEDVRPHGPYLSLTPMSGGPDGFFVARMVRRAQ